MLLHCECRSGAHAVTHVGSSQGKPLKAVYIVPNSMDKARSFKALHIVAHSMGNLVLQEGLGGFLRPGDWDGQGVTVEQSSSGYMVLHTLQKGGIRITITLAAPDLDHDRMTNLLDNVESVPTPRGDKITATLYSSRKDMALALSSLLAGVFGDDRKGRAGFYGWLVGRKNHKWHIFFHPGVLTVKISGMYRHTASPVKYVPSSTPWSRQVIGTGGKKWALNIIG